MIRTFESLQGRQKRQRTKTVLPSLKGLRAFLSSKPSPAAAGLGYFQWNKTLDRYLRRPSPRNRAFNAPGRTAPPNCLAKSLSSNRAERIVYRDLLLERLRVVPKGHWKLAGGANHRFVANSESEPRQGPRKPSDAIPPPLTGLVGFGVRNRWFAPPANFHDTFGVRYSMQTPVTPCRQKTGRSSGGPGRITYAQCAVPTSPPKR
jgi:hypothetical protein